MRYNIPPRNFLYLLAYAFNLKWDCLEGDVRDEDFDDASFLELFSFVLVKWTEELLKRGLYRTFNLRKERSKRIKGRILFTPTLKEQCFRTGKAVCQFDDLSFDTLENQIILSTLRFCRRQLSISTNNRDIANLDSSLPKLVRLMNSFVNYRPLSNDLFNQLIYHRTNIKYKRILALCKLIYDCSGLEKLGDQKLFDLDEEKMNDIFEEFLRKYLKENLEKSGYLVESKAPRDWIVKHKNQPVKHIPIINPDIVIFKKKKPCIVLDAKFYKQAVYKSGRRYKNEGNENYKTQSHNLYQILSYSSYYNCDGVLVYAQTKRGHFEEMVGINPLYYRKETLPNFNFGFYTLDLSGSLNEFENRMNNFAHEIIVKRIEEKFLN